MKYRNHMSEEKVFTALIINYFIFSIEKASSIKLNALHMIIKLQLPIDMHLSVC